MTAKKPIVKAHKGTRQIKARYPSFAAAAAENGMDGSAIKRLCWRKTLPEGAYFFRYADEYDPAEDFTGKRNVPVVTFDVNENKLTWFSSITECAEAYYITSSYLSNAIANRKLILGRYRAYYAPKRISC